MSSVVKIVAHPKSCVTNHELIELIVLDALERQGKSWEEFMSRKIRTSRWRKAEIPDDAPREFRETEAQGKSLGGRIEKISLETLIGSRILKKRVKVNSQPEPSPPSRKDPNKHKDTGKQKEGERAHLEEVPLPGKDETQLLLHKIENLEKENKKLRQQLEENKVEARVPGLDTLAEVVDKMRVETTLCYVCATCARDLVEVGYKVCATKTVSTETQTKP